jgi:hypothetical protein
MDFNLQFDLGKISAIKSGMLAADTIDSYKFLARVGQVMSVSVASKEANASFDVLYQEENGDWVYIDTQEGIASEKKAWSGILPHSRNNKYLIEVNNYFSPLEAEYDLFVGLSTVAVDNHYIERLVTKYSADGIYLGMALPEVIEKTSSESVMLGCDGEGSISLEILTNNKFLMALYMDTDCIGRESKVNVIEAWGREFATQEGVFPTMPLSEAIDIYGGLETIQFSESEAREFATFVNHPEGILFEVYGGDFPDNENYTQATLADAQVVALWIKC